jgi:hypothetical protein
MSYKLEPSTRSGKKWMVTTPDGKKVHFGAAGMSDYTKHQDPDRKENYIKRHAGNMPKGLTSRREDWTKSGLDTAGFWSRWLTWNRPTLEASIADIEDRFGITIDYRGRSKKQRPSMTSAQSRRSRNYQPQEPLDYYTGRYLGEFQMPGRYPRPLQNLTPFYDRPSYYDDGTAFYDGPSYYDLTRGGLSSISPR